jgi:hypothetical protein
VTPQLRVLAGKDVVAQARAGRGEELRLRNVGVPNAEAGALVVLKAVEGRNADDRWLLRVGVEAPLDQAEHEPNDTVATATRAPLDQTLAGFLWPGDVDFYCPDRTDGLVAATLEGVERVDLKLDRVSRDGKVLAHADEGGVGKGEALPPGPPDCVRVAARARDVAFDAPYRLTLRAVAAAPDLEREPNNGPGSATPWPDGAPTMRGYLAPRGDEDWFRFTAPAGKTRARVSLEAPSGLAASVRLVDEARAPLGPSTGPTRAEGPIAAGKTYFVAVKPQSDKAANATDAYTVSLTLE